MEFALKVPSERLAKVELFPMKANLENPYYGRQGESKYMINPAYDIKGTGQLQPLYLQKPYIKVFITDVNKKEIKYKEPEHPKFVILGKEEFEKDIKDRIKQNNENIEKIEKMRVNEYNPDNVNKLIKMQIEYEEMQSKKKYDEDIKEDRILRELNSLKALYEEAKKFAEGDLETIKLADENIRTVERYIYLYNIYYTMPFDLILKLLKLGTIIAVVSITGVILYYLFKKSDKHEIKKIVI